MRLHRFIGPFDLGKATLSVTDSEFINQWKNVLRLKTGDKVILSDGEGREALATITDADKKEVTFDLEPAETPNREPKKKVTLYCALFKRENFEIVVQKATEIGVTKIVPLLAERTVKTGFNRERLEKIMREACEQCGRTTLMEISEPMKFADAIETVDPKESTLFDVDGEPATIPLPAVNCFIGPEGGFTDAEIAFSRAAGFPTVSLGDLILRGETAAIVVSFLATR